MKVPALWMFRLAIPALMIASFFACSSGEENEETDGDRDLESFWQDPALKTCETLDFETGALGETQTKTCEISVVGASNTIREVRLSNDTPGSFEIISYKNGAGEELWPLSGEIPIEVLKPHVLSVRYEANSTCGEAGRVLVESTLGASEIALKSAAQAETGFSPNPAVLDFGQVVFTTESADQKDLPLGLANTSTDGSLTVSSVSFRESDSGPFHFDPDGECQPPFDIAPGGEKICTLRFAPVVAGPQGDFMEIAVEKSGAGCAGAVELRGDTCTPDCTDKECGDDGCGGSCGECTAPEVCFEFACCLPDCTDKECGDDTCGGSCGDCPEQHECIDFVCECVPDCENKECGDDGCGGDCGVCSAGECRGGRCCPCSSGECCDGCKYEDSDHTCDSHYDETFQCDGYCGGKGQHNIAVMKCSGYSAECNGSIEWKGWSTLENCNDDEICQATSSGVSCEASNSCCENECDWYDQRCYSGQSYQVCEDTDSDGCSEWGEPIACPANFLCSGGYCE